MMMKKIFLCLTNLILVGALYGAGSTPLKDVKISGTSAVTSGTFTINSGVTFDVSAGTVTFATNQIAWTKVNKSGSSLADLATRSASDLSSGTVPFARLPTGTGSSNVVAGGVVTGATKGDATHVPQITYNAAGQITGVTEIVITGGGGATDFTDLGDVPTSYTGEAGKVVVVNGTEDGLDFTDAGSGNVSAVATGSSTATLTYASNGDTNGVIYFMGTNFGFTTFSNPDGITLTLSSNGLHAVSGTIDGLTDRAASHVVTNGTGGATAQYYQFDLGSSRSLVINHYTLKMRDNATTSLPSSWKLQCSDDGSSWTDIQTDSFAFSSINEIHDFAVAGQTLDHRYWRVQLVTDNSASGFFCLGEVELYGSFSYLGGFGSVDNELTLWSGMDGKHIKRATGSGIIKLTSGVASTVSSTTVGENILSLTNPSAISFVKIAADNSTSTRTPSQMKTDLGLVIGTDVQAYDADLTTYAGIPPSANVQTFLGAANYAAMKTQLALTIGTNVETWDADLDTWAGITPGTGVGTFLATPSSANLAAALTDENGSGKAIFAAGTLAITSGKTATFSNTLTFTGTDSSSVAFGAGGTVLYSGSSIGLLGTTSTNDNASAGQLGEYVEAVVASGSAVALTTATAKTVTSISLTSGDWDLSGDVNYSTVGGPTITVIVQGSSTTNNATDVDDTYTLFRGSFTGAFPISMVIPTRRVSIASTTTVYLVAQATFTGGTSCSAFGRIRARRMR